jgi:hypothetical protein
VSRDRAGGGFTDFVLGGVSWNRIALDSASGGCLLVFPRPAETLCGWSDPSPFW